MEKTCPNCGKVFVSEYPSKVYCSKSCSREARYKKDETYYADFPQAADAEPLFSFECANCGKTVVVYSKFDQRTKFCCGICARAYKNVREKKRLAKFRGGNLGLSGGMSLGSLKRREARSVDKDDGVEVRICPTCGKHFEVSKRRGERKYCSIECEYEAERKKDASNLGIRICEVCGAEYPAVHVSQKYCSPKCRAHRNYVQQRESGAVQNFKIAHGKFGIRIRLNKTCPVCGKAFVAEGSKSHQKYCNAACREKAKETRHGKEKRGTGTAG